MPGRDLTRASPPAVDLMTLHHGCLRLLLTCLPVMWATAEPRVGDADMALAPFKHQDTPRSKFFFFTEKHEENLQKTQLGVVALL